MRTTLQCPNFVQILSPLLTSHVVALVAEEALESFFEIVPARFSVDTCASETVSVTLRNALIDCTTRVIVMYRPPSSCFKTFLDDVSKVLLIAAAHPTETIVCGDFNTRYKDSTCTDAINLADLLDTSGFVQHVSGATHERGNILDLIVTAKTPNLLTIPVSPTTLLTDHYALESDLKGNNNKALYKFLLLHIHEVYAAKICIFQKAHWHCIKCGISNSLKCYV